MWRLGINQWGKWDYRGLKSHRTETDVIARWLMDHGSLDLLTIMGDKFIWSTPMVALEKYTIFLGLPLLGSYLQKKKRPKVTQAKK